ncbi:MAG: hypothetical protein ACREPA_04325 [Candidatus Dormibacteraceae bacterium]
MDLPDAGRRLREEAEAHPLKLPVRRRVDERHHLATNDGLEVWFTIQISPHARVYDAVFERGDRMPSDEDCAAWLGVILPDRQALEVPSPPGSRTRRFEVFEREAGHRAPVA